MKSTPVPKMHARLTVTNVASLRYNSMMLSVKSDHCLYAGLANDCKRDNQTEGFAMTCTAHVTPANKTHACLTDPISQARCIAVRLLSNLPAELQTTLSLPGWQLSVQKCKLNMLLPAIGLTDACYLQVPSRSAFGQEAHI